MRPVGDELFRADGRTDMTKLIVAFRDFANVPKTPCIPSRGKIEERRGECKNLKAVYLWRHTLHY